HGKNDGDANWASDGSFCLKPVRGGTPGARPKAGLNDYHWGRTVNQFTYHPNYPYFQVQPTNPVQSAIRTIVLPNQAEIRGKWDSERVVLVVGFRWRPRRIRSIQNNWNEAFLWHRCQEFVRSVGYLSFRGVGPAELGGKPAGMRCDEPPTRGILVGRMRLGLGEHRLQLVDEILHVLELAVHARKSDE